MNVQLFYIISVISVLLTGISGLAIGNTTKTVKNILATTNGKEVRNLLKKSRRILNGHEVETNRPYMVYLKLPSNNAKFKEYEQWLCGGVIIHEEYILTSAACIEDVMNFYIVSGMVTHREGDTRHNNLCFKNGAKKAIWKCVPKNYEFDGHENDNIRWMNNDIAVVKVEDEFDFSRRVRGCDYIPKPICFNNQSSRYEDSDIVAVVAGWGTTLKYNDWISTSTSRRQIKRTGQQLMEADVTILSKQRCKQRWAKRYHNIIDNYMICTKDSLPDMSEACVEKFVECTDINYSDDEGDDPDSRRAIVDPEKLFLHSALHNTTRRADISSGGFCENDHGGPLIYGTGTSSMVIGIISACLVRERSNACYGPFLYTSVYKNKKVINCAIYKDSAGSCEKVFRAGESHAETELSWVNHPDGPSKHDIKKARRMEELKNATMTEKNATIIVNVTTSIIETTSVKGVTVDAN